MEKVGSVREPQKDTGPQGAVTLKKRDTFETDTILSMVFEFFWIKFDACR